MRLKGIDVMVRRNVLMFHDTGTFVYHSGLRRIPYTVQGTQG
jgi:hypothetical protein